MIGIDTFSWGKLIKLRNEKWKDIVDEMIEETQFFITNSVKKEFEFRFPTELELLLKVAILPDIKHEKYRKWIIKGFDEADATLLEYSDLKEYRLITEDIPMLNEGITNKKNIIHLIDFFKELYYIDFITKTEFYQLIKTFREWKNITLKKEKLLMYSLNKPKIEQ